MKIETYVKHTKRTSYLNYNLKRDYAYNINDIMYEYPLSLVFFLRKCV